MLQKGIFPLPLLHFGHQWLNLGFLFFALGSNMYRVLLTLENFRPSYEGFSDPLSI